MHNTEELHILEVMTDLATAKDVLPVRLDILASAVRMEVGPLLLALVRLESAGKVDLGKRGYSYDVTLAGSPRNSRMSVPEAVKDYLRRRGPSIRNQVCLGIKRNRGAVYAEMDAMLERREIHIESGGLYALGPPADGDISVSDELQHRILEAVKRNPGGLLSVRALSRLLHRRDASVHAAVVALERSGVLVRMAGTGGWVVREPEDKPASAPVGAP